MNLVDIHVLTIPGRECWLESLLNSLDRQPCNVFVVAGDPSDFPASRVSGYQYGSAEYVGFADDDDLVTPGAIDELLNALKANPNAIGAYTDESWIDETGKITNTGLSAGKAWSIQRHVQTPFFVHHLWIAKREVIERVLPAVSNAGAAIDFFTTCYAALSGEWVHVNKIGYLWRTHKGCHHLEKHSTNYSLFGDIRNQLRNKYGVECCS